MKRVEQISRESSSVEPAWLTSLKKRATSRASALALVALAEVAQACAPVAREVQPATPNTPTASLETKPETSVAENTLHEIYGAEWDQVKALHATDARSDARAEARVETQWTGWDGLGASAEDMRETMLAHIPASWARVGDVKLLPPLHHGGYDVSARRQPNGAFALSIYDVPGDREADTDRDYAWILRDGPSRAFALVNEPVVSPDLKPQQRAELTARAYRIFSHPQRPTFVEIDLVDTGGEKTLLGLRRYMTRLLTLGIQHVGNESVKTQEAWMASLERELITTYGSDAMYAHECSSWIVDTLQAESPGFEPWKENRLRVQAVVRTAERMQSSRVENGMHPTGVMKDLATAVSRADASVVHRPPEGFSLPPMQGLTPEAQEVFAKWITVVDHVMAYQDMASNRLPTRTFSGYPTSAQDVETMISFIPESDRPALMLAMKTWTIKTLSPSRP